MELFIQVHYQLGWCGKNLSLDHFFFWHVTFFRGLHSTVVGISSMQPFDIGLHATHFGGAYIFRKDIQLCFHIIYLQLSGSFEMNVAWKVFKTKSYLLHN